MKPLLEFEPFKEGYLFTEDDLELSLEDHIKHWYEAYHKLDMPVSLFKAAEFREGFVEVKFLLLCQAVEIYHRRFFEEPYLPKADWKEFLNSAKEYLIPKVPESYQEVLSNKLGGLNEQTLRDRLESLIYRYKFVFETHEDVSTIFADKIAKARNYLTHYSRSKEPFAGNDLLVFSEILRALFRLSMMEQMGFSLAKIQEIALQTGSFMFLKGEIKIWFENSK